MSQRGPIPSVDGMNTNTTTSLNWPMILGLGALALIRPLVSIVESVLGVTDSPAVPLTITLVISAIWIAAVGLTKTAHPVQTLVLTGVTYAGLSLILSAVLSPILTGSLQGPLANPVALLPFLLTNVIWGLITGGLALALQRIRGAGRNSSVTYR